MFSRLRTCAMWSLQVWSMHKPDIRKVLHVDATELEHPFKT